MIVDVPRGKPVAKCEELWLFKMEYCWLWKRLAYDNNNNDYGNRQTAQTRLAAKEIWYGKVEVEVQRR